MSIHMDNRDLVIQALKEELVGPSPQGKELDCSSEISFTDIHESYGPWRQKGTGEEILMRDTPVKRYGIGVLYPFELDFEVGPEDTDPKNVGDDIIEGTGPTTDDEADMSAQILSENGIKGIRTISKRKYSGNKEADPDDFDLSTANSYKPSSMAVSFFAELPEDSEIIVEVSGGRYKKKNIIVNGNPRQWWLRSPISILAKFNSTDICAKDSNVCEPSFKNEENCEGMELSVKTYSRTLKKGSSRTRLITTAIINTANGNDGYNEKSLFQTYFKVSVVSPFNANNILPYPKEHPEYRDKEEQSLDLLYRKIETYAVGHGCAANWGGLNETLKAEWVGADCLPYIETRSITPDISRDDGTAIEVSMAELAGLVPDNDGFDSLSEVIGLYKNWIDNKKKQASSMDAHHKDAAEHHMSECIRCHDRMRDGLEYLKTNQVALKAFKYANHAVHLQQTRSRREPRKITYDEKNKHLIFSDAYTDPEPFVPVTGRGKWRAFQIAFFLMSVRSAANGEAPDRRTVELIWFPTGGGKTEAYLGLAAFSTFYRRLINPEDDGVNVLMRYTLRLLTAQQFTRAAGLACAMEYIRRHNGNTDELGEKVISIGIWLGKSITPNKRDEAIKALRDLKKGTDSENLFILDRCPWCGAQMGVVSCGKKVPRHVPRVIGYEQDGNTVVFKCYDRSCEFSEGMPVYVIDEDIYEKRPSFLIGTVDKFAMLAWQDKSRSIFGISSDGERFCSPPGLIIQDELHLISGPLGSMVGLYEAVIEELCTDRRKPVSIFPKIVCSTATIRRYNDQIKALYGRDDAILFPPPGLDVEDSFFSRYAVQSDGKPERGRIYLGVHAPGLGSMQTAQVRTFTTLLQAPVPLSKGERDPWWTLLVFFNSLRELGTTLSLLQSDIPDRFKVIGQRFGIPRSSIRTLDNIRELTSRLRSDEIPEAISSLERTPSSPGKLSPVDVCLTSSIMEVGIDINRLSLMAVVGQPKTTSQYIQVTGRVGRNWRDRAGLVVTLYSPSKPRDRSHFEKFKSYHERLYSHVEPTSVTPFSPPALDRALHAIMVAYVRQSGNERIADSPYPFPDDLVEKLHQILLPRVRFIDPEEEENYERVFKQRSSEWKSWERTIWQGSGMNEDAPLLRNPGAYANPAFADISWATPMSMRNVDAECQAEITYQYLTEGEV